MTLEELLNKLIEKGWKPFYDEIKTKWGVRWNYPLEWTISVRKNTIFIHYRYESGDEWITKRKKVQHSIRELVSKESGLWKFCIENNIVKLYDSWANGVMPVDDVEYGARIEYKWHTDYQYRIIEASLKDESELEYFLLQNIKIEWNEKI